MLGPTPYLAPSVAVYGNGNGGGYYNGNGGGYYNGNGGGYYNGNGYGGYCNGNGGGDAVLSAYGRARLYGGSCRRGRRHWCPTQRQPDLHRQPRLRAPQLLRLMLAQHGDASRRRVVSRATVGWVAALARARVRALRGPG